VVVRGINKSDLFLSNTDKQVFIDILKKVKQDGEYQLFAYCLMNNHVHLLMEAQGTFLQRTMKRILQRYARHFNQSNKRIGHVFQDRYWSQGIDSQHYFMACARYIHRNPVQACIVEAPEDYSWSSYEEYISPPDKGLTDTGRLFSCFSPNILEASRMLQEFTRIDTDEVFLDCVEDSEIIQAILARHGIQNSEELKLLRKDARNAVILQLLKATRLPRRGLARKLGINKRMVYGAGKSGQ